MLPYSNSFSRLNGNKARAALFDAILDSCGYELVHLTKHQRGRVNQAAKELEDVGASPALVRGFGVQWEQHYPGMTLTPQTITKHWADYMARKLSQPASRR